MNDHVHPSLPSLDDQDLQMADAWLAAAADPTIDRALREIYSTVTASIEQQGPACWASGRCCNFAVTGHRLYVTGLEAAWCVRQVGRAGHQAIARAIDLGDCPYLDGKHRHLCGVHHAKPLGCRVYFCDQSSFPWQHDLTEAQLAKLRALHEEHDIAYRYAEWRTLLHTIEHAPAARKLPMFAAQSPDNHLTAIRISPRES